MLSLCKGLLFSFYLKKRFNILVFSLISPQISQFELANKHKIHHQQDINPLLGSIHTKVMVCNPYLNTKSLFDFDQKRKGSQKFLIGL
jgi:hypothetical protein